MHLILPHNLHIMDYDIFYLTDPHIISKPICTYYFFLLELVLNYFLYWDIWVFLGSVFRLHWCHWHINQQMIVSIKQNCFCIFIFILRSVPVFTLHYSLSSFPHPTFFFFPIPLPPMLFFLMVSFSLVCSIDTPSFFLLVYLYFHFISSLHIHSFYFPPQSSFVSPSFSFAFPHDHPYLSSY